METNNLIQVPAEVLEVLTKLGALSNEVRQYIETEAEKQYQQALTQVSDKKTAAQLATSEIEWLKKAQWHIEEAVKVILDKVREQMEEAVFNK